jgi:SAM-dependent methyltransferase
MSALLRRRIARLIPASLRPALKKIYYLPIDAIDRVKVMRRGTSSMIPPRSMVFVGVGDFEAIGREFRRYFVEVAGLKPADRVLDVGCGIGRMAVPLTDYLTAGEYHGFDIVKKGIDWCQSRITPRFPNFHFQHSDVYNRHYNSGGTIQARAYRFPFGDASFDFVFLTSVFTHMLAPDLERYLAEIARVLKPGGRCLATFFLLNEESRRLIAQDRSALDFKHRRDDGCLTISERDPEEAIAYDEVLILNLFEKHNLEVLQPIHYGSWSGRPRFLSYQDIVLATKQPH